VIRSPRAAGRTACRVCGVEAATPVGEVEYLSGYAWTVFDCQVCGCRFTQHDSRIYGVLHASGAISYYDDYRRIASECRRFFTRGDREGLKRFLSQTTKYRFIIDEVTREPTSSRLLEIGCSRGYLTSYFILEGRHVLGIDVSADAVHDAREAFGDHFALADLPGSVGDQSCDVIYHVGLIGCVADPIGMTRRLLKLLKPGGRLLFNSPNRAALHLHGQLWLDSAPPPDLVTLFPEGFWKSRFGNVADVIENTETLPQRNAVVIGLRRLFGRGWSQPASKPLTAEGNLAHTWCQSVGAVWHLFERIVTKVASASGVDVVVPRRPSDFGLFVQMTAR
jgi:SAM-dependent methyltransferase